jgi:CheY-like chemotaxis protein
LENEGYSVIATATGLGALEEDSRGNPHVIILDYHLPDMDGLECLRTIRQRRGLRHPRVTVFTADWDVFDHDAELTSLGAVITSKLCDFNQLHAVISYLSPAYTLLRGPRLEPETL